MRVAVLLLVQTILSAQAVPKSINPTVKKIVDEVSEQNIINILKKLESFETRNTFSATGDPEHGIGAARKWIYDQFRSYSPKLEVYYDGYKVKKQPRVFRDVEVVNVVAVLPGTINKDRQVIISAHYDSLNRVTKPGKPAPGEQPEVDEEKTVAARAPGVTDDASGTAAVMELARIMSQYQFEKTIVFVTFAGEEQALLGSSSFAMKAEKEKRQIEGVLNNDIIGSEVSGNGRSDNSTVRIFSPDPRDSTSRELARYLKIAGERYVPSMKVDLIFREDRFGRGGDHMPFIAHGFPAVRLTTASENYTNQHTATDTFANTSPAYITRVTKVNGAVLASLALAPMSPVVTREIKTGPNKGKLTPNLARGKSQYDAVLKWTDPNPKSNLLGYSVVYRSTRAPFWENETFVGNVKEFTLENVSVDEYLFGVKAIDKDGNESLVAAYGDGSFVRREIEIY